jgi:hypothetical protein
VKPDFRANTGRSQDYRDGYARALKDCVNWLHVRAQGMNDHHATQLLNSAAFALGVHKDELATGTSPEMVDE